MLVMVVKKEMPMLFLLKGDEQKCYRKNCKNVDPLVKYSHKKWYKYEILWGKKTGNSIVCKRKNRKPDMVKNLIKLKKKTYFANR